MRLGTLFDLSISQLLSLTFAAYSLLSLQPTHYSVCSLLTTQFATYSLLSLQPTHYSVCSLLTTQFAAYSLLSLQPAFGRVLSSASGRLLPQNVHLPPQNLISSHFRPHQNNYLFIIRKFLKKNWGGREDFNFIAIHTE